MPYLMFIINGALETGNFLKALQVALVKPSLKKETLDSDLLGNYRPVSNIAFMSKILENILIRTIFGENISQHIENFIVVKQLSPR